MKELVDNGYQNLAVYLKFINNVSNRFANNYKILSNYIDETIETPEEKKINKDYVMIRWSQYSYLLNDRHLDDSYRVYQDLKDYIEQFNEKDIDVAKAKLRLKTYPLIIHVIKQETNEGKKLALESIKTAQELNDPKLEVIFNKELLNFYFYEKDLDGYIKTAEETLKIAETLEDKGHYFMLLPQLLNAYIFKGGYEEQSLALLDDLYNFEEEKSLTYIYYAQFLSSNADNKELIDRVLNKFEVNTILEFVNKVKPIIKSNLVDNEYIRFLNFASLALVRSDYAKEAFSLKQEALDLTREVFSKELSESLSNYKAGEAIRVKEKELENQRETTTLIIGIAILLLILLVLTIYGAGKYSKQSKELTDKNKIIEESLKEKELLIKEVHHRVKNNFQVISSLLALQKQDLKDKNPEEILEKTQNRIKSMALIHQRLYENKDTLIDFSEYIKNLVTEISKIYKYEDNLEIKLDLESIYFDVDTANPLGLILNEKITNCFKHAFKRGEENVLFISLKYLEEYDFYQLIIKDNGPGLEENFNAETLKTTGLKLVKRLVKQLQGKLYISSDNGLKVEILFKDTKHRKKVN